MSDYLLKSALELSDNEVGGYGHQWEVFGVDAADALSELLPAAVSGSGQPTVGIWNSEHALRSAVPGEPIGLAGLYVGATQGCEHAGIVTVFHIDESAKTTNVVAFFPFLAAGCRVSGRVEQICLHPSRLEAHLNIALDNGALIVAFEPLFANHRDLYRAGRTCVFTVFALAYSIRPQRETEFLIDDPAQIRAFHARDAWVKEHGVWSRENHEAAMAAWRPQSEDDLAPLRISTAGMAALVPASAGPACHSEFRGTVVSVTPDSVSIIGVRLWRVDILVIRAESDVVLPVYVSPRAFNGDWRPAAGDNVEGVAWINAYLSGS